MLPYLPGRLSHFGFSHCVFMNVLSSSGMLPEALFYNFWMLYGKSALLCNLGVMFFCLQVI